MKLAPIQLESYFLTDLNCQANPQFRPDRETRFSERDLEVSAAVQPIKDRPHRWQATLGIKLQPAADSNSPYSFRLNLVGYICWVGRDLPQDRLEALLRTNGPSMLYGAAREIARDITARGPFPPLLLPSVSFTPEAQVLPQPKAPATSQQPATATPSNVPTARKR
jgi:preprotein translocase subunit SecB